MSRLLLHGNQVFTYIDIVDIMLKNVLFLCFRTTESLYCNWVPSVVVLRPLTILPC